MRGFTLLCFVAITAAAPQGYNYPVHYNNQYFTPSTDGESALNGQNSYYVQQQPVISKRFFLHAAPEEEETEFQHRDIVIGQGRRNFNVVFIKSPVAAVQKTKLRIVPAVNEDKTIIYVLAKKAGENEVIAHVEEPHTTTAKPEVFFIKYKTNEEAEHAQRSIQADFDSLGGSSTISDEGISPISSVIGSLDAHDTGLAQSVMNAVTGIEINNSSYLPPIKK